MNANATDTTAGQRLSVMFSQEELAAIAEFQLADVRPDKANAIRALTFLGLDAWRNKGRPKGQRLPPVAAPDQPEAQP